MCLGGRWDSGLQGNASWAGPLWNACASCKHCKMNCAATISQNSRKIINQQYVVILFFSHQVRAGESLMKLVSDLKQFLILNDFPSVNDAISHRNQQLRTLQEECDKKLISLRDEIAIDLYELEEEYYSSRYK